MENKSEKKRAVICLCLVLTVFLCYVLRLFDWQIINGDKYRSAAISSISYTQTSDSVRGEILDVNGVPLAVNEPYYELVINKLYIDRETENQTILKLSQILGGCGERLINELPIYLDAENVPQFAGGKEEAVSALKTDFLEISENASALSCLRSLAKRYGLPLSMAMPDLFTLVCVKYGMEINEYGYSNPYVMATKLRESSVSIISELTQGIGGAEIRTRLARINKNSTVAPHIVGALGSLSEDEYEKLKDKGYSYDAQIGKFGIEAALESELRGESGTKTVQRNADGTVVGVIKQTPAKPGNTVYLTIDSKVQSATNKALADNVTAAQNAGKSKAAQYGESGYGEDCTAGAAVMLNLKDFSVIAASSYPTFDLDAYYNDEYYAKIAADPLSPMFSRAFDGEFAPGSILKPAVACAALQEKVVKPDETVFCSHYYTYYPGTTVACMGYHGAIDIRTALERSCNYFFAEMGRRLGIDAMYLYAEKFGLGVRTGVEISEASGILAGRDSTNWYEGNTVSASIGQSDNAFSPIQLATYAATLANNGVRLRTHLVSKVTDYSREKVIYENTPENAEFMSNAGISAENMKIVQESMRRVAVSGTASSVFSDYPIPIAAKTGTAENSGSDHVTFICYAPYENPQIALCVVLEHGASSKYSMAVAKAMLDAYFLKNES